MSQGIGQSVISEVGCLFLLGFFAFFVLGEDRLLLTTLLATAVHLGLNAIWITDWCTGGRLLAPAVNGPVAVGFASLSFALALAAAALLVLPQRQPPETAPGTNDGPTN